VTIGSSVPRVLGSSVVRSVTEDPRTRGPEDPQQRIERIYELQQRNRAAVASTTAAQRIAKLRRFEKAIFAHQDDIRAAMWEDYRKPAAEVDLSEIYPVVSEARHAIRHLRSWMRPKRVGMRMALLGSRSSILHEPKGVVLILAPWNFPFNLTLGPLVAAVAAGNCVMLKPSELTPKSTACMKRILGEVFDESEVAVIEGDAPIAEALLKKKFDHIFFTGSPAVGRIVMKAAAEHLTSVTLELGGKSPVIVDESASIDEAAKKVAWAKFFNCGQICIAPDYVLAEAPIRDELVDKIRRAVDSFEAGNPGGKRIVNERHFDRLTTALAATKGTVAIGGGSDPASLKIQPTVVVDPAPDEPLMTDEIFGPILPVVTVQSLDEAITFVNARPKPLAAYLFTKTKSVRERVIKEVPAGGMLVNHLVFHFATHKLPFGGVGPSGMGAYHGKFGFEAFSHRKSVMTKPTRPDVTAMIYPPYTEKAWKLARKLF